MFVLDPKETSKIQPTESTSRADGPVLEEIQKSLPIQP